MFQGEIFDPFAKVECYLKVTQNKLFTHNWVFLLHHKCSFIFSLIGLVIIASYPAMIEDPIACFGPHENEVPKEFLQEWCWLSGTYIVPQHIDALLGKEVPHSGIGPDDLEHGTTERLYHNQYIFYPVIFLLMFTTFFGSKHIWKLLEGNRLKNLLSELTTAIVDCDVMRKRINLVTDYMTNKTETFHSSYAYKFIFVEVLNFCNVLLQFWALNEVLHNGFVSYGFDALAYINHVRQPGVRPPMQDPFTRLFPKLAMCHFTKSGPSGNPVPQEALCVMPLHNLADKLFLMWWFWLCFLGICSVLALVYRGILLCCPKARYCLLRFKVNLCDPADLRYFVDNSSYGDWFVLSLMHKNMDCWVFAQLVQELVVKMKETQKKVL